MTAPASQTPLFRSLPDHAAEQDDRALPIDKVGIKDLSYPIQVLDRDNKLQSTIGRFNLYVSLPSRFKGTHMSRFIEVLNAHRGEITIRNMPSILADIQARLEAEDAHLEVSFPYFVSKRAPVSGVESLMEYPCRFHASKRGSHVDFVLGVRVPVKSLCPCSKSISDRGAHNQRSLVDVEIRSTEFIWIEDVVQSIESCASAPLFALLKREDEKYVTELAYDNPKFVEDLVRDVVVSMRNQQGVRWLRVSAENQESIHNHSAYAQIEWSEEEAGAFQSVLPLHAQGPADTAPFGAWLRQHRSARGFTQQELADHLGISAAHLSRVESGEKRLSEDAISRAANLLGIDHEEATIRAGVLSADVLALLSSHSRELMEWISARRPSQPQ